MHPIATHFKSWRSAVDCGAAGKPADAVARLIDYASRRKQFAQHIDSLSVCLREPRSCIHSLCRRNRRFLKRTEKRRHLLQSPQAAKQIGNTISCDQMTAFDRLCRSDSRSRIVATFHFGEFTYGINYLMSGAAARHQRYFLTLAPCQPATYTNMRRAIGPSVADRRSEIVLAKTTMRDLSALLRQPRTNLVLFCDLPNELGERINVSFLQRQAWFPKGPATLALMNRVPVVPVICVQQPDGLKVYCAEQIEPPARGSDRTEAVQQLTQQLVDYFARFFRQQPEQWRYLQRLPEYFAPPEARQEPTQKSTGPTSSNTHYQ